MGFFVALFFYAYELIAIILNEGVVISAVYLELKTDSK